MIRNAVIFFYTDLTTGRLVKTFSKWGDSTQLQSTILALSRRGRDEESIEIRFFPVAAGGSDVWIQAIIKLREEVKENRMADTTTRSKTDAKEILKVVEGEVLRLGGMVGISKTITNETLGLSRYVLEENLTQAP